MSIWVGIDDTDSPNGMCTTYLAVLIIEELSKNGIEIIGFPRLIRLNPTIPFKTRGNGAVSFLVKSDDFDSLIEHVDRLIKEYAEMDNDRTNPGAVFVEPEDGDLMETLFRFSKLALREVVTIDEAVNIIERYRIPFLKYKLGRGLIGALASVGTHLDDYTLEKIAYRLPERFGTLREVNKESFFKADKRTYPFTWDTVDWHNKVTVCIPNSPDPILFGIRGDKLSAIDEVFNLVETEPINKEIVFLTNQGTDMHLFHERELKSIRNYTSFVLKGRVVEKPVIEKGGHVFLLIQSKFGIVKCAAFEPTKQFREIISSLIEGDLVEVYGSMKKDTINLEKINVLNTSKHKPENPDCPVCGKKMKSAGKGQGYRCKICKTARKEKVIGRVNRSIEEGFYEVPPCARRHISKPLVRMDVKSMKHIFK